MGTFKDALEEIQETEDEACSKNKKKNAKYAKEDEVNDDKDSNEADGSMGDLGVAPSDHNPTLKYKLKGKCGKCGKEPCTCDANEDADMDEVVADKNVTNKKAAGKVAKARKAAKCSGNMTPSRVPGPKIRFKCTPIDKSKSMKAKKTAKKTARSAAGKKGRKAAQKTKAFRKG